MQPTASEAVAMRTSEVTYPGTAEHIRAVRADLRPLLVDCPMADDVILCASELAANAAQYGRERMTLSLALDHGTLHIVVTDSGTTVERRHRDAAPDEHGRGTGIVQYLAQSTEIHQTRGGREVRACLRCSA